MHVREIRDDLQAATMEPIAPNDSALQGVIISDEPLDLSMSSSRTSQDSFTSMPLSEASPLTPASASSSQSSSQSSLQLVPDTPPPPVNATYGRFTVYGLSAERQAAVDSSQGLNPESPEFKPVITRVWRCVCVCVCVIFLLHSPSIHLCLSFALKLHYCIISKSPTLVTSLLSINFSDIPSKHAERCVFSMCVCVCVCACIPHSLFLFCSELLTVVEDEHRALQTAEGTAKSQERMETSSSLPAPPADTSSPPSSSSSSSFSPISSTSGFDGCDTNRGAKRKLKGTTVPLGNPQCLDVGQFAASTARHSMPAQPSAPVRIAQPLQRQLHTLPATVSVPPSLLLLFCLSHVACCMLL